MKAVFMNITRIKDLILYTTTFESPDSLLVFWYSPSVVPPNYNEFDILKILLMYLKYQN